MALQFSTDPTDPNNAKSKLLAALMGAGGTGASTGSTTQPNTVTGPDVTGGGTIDPNQAAWQAQNPGKPYPSAPTTPNHGDPSDPLAGTSAAQWDAQYPGQPYPNSGGTAPAESPADPTVDRNAPASSSSASSSSTSSSNDSSLPSGLAAIYKKYGVTDGGRGAGFTDAAYWADKPDQWQRLDADLAGTGPDQPGPKDTGAALNSGRGGSGSSGSGSGLFNPLSLVPGANLPNLSGQDPADTVLSRILAALTTYGNA